MVSIFLFNDDVKISMKIQIVLFGVNNFFVFLVLNNFIDNIIVMGGNCV